MTMQNKRGHPGPRPQMPPPVATLHYPLPRDTQRAWEQFRTENKRCLNPGLIFERYLGYLPGWRLDDKTTSPKKDALERVRATQVSGELLTHYRERWLAMMREENAEILQGNPQWRFITGLGQKGPLEVGFTFHSLYGFPMIPGSALKGMTRAYLELFGEEIAQAEETDVAVLKTRAEQVFGSTDKQGRAIFYDAIPAEAPTLELDVMNPHYPKYYQGTSAPTNWQSPQPVFFLTVGSKSRFLFAVGGEEKDAASKWLSAALNMVGVGAKTSAGYGFWNASPYTGK